MAAWLIAVVGIIYLFVGISLVMTNKLGIGIAFVGYAFANIGLYMEALK